MRRFSFALALTLAAPLATTATTIAYAQVSDSERAAARQLFSEGDKLQSDGKYDEALDKFQRAQKVFSAPTNLLRIAQCQAMLGKLVESAETYRTLIRTPLPANSPAAFGQAVEQAKVELGQVDQRVPTVKIDVTPANAQNLQVQLNGQTLNAALLGEPLPLDPGTHKILVFAPGYASSEQSITLKERDKKSLSFTLKATGGVAYGNGAITTPPAGNGTGSDGTTAPPPPPPPDQWQTARKPATSSLLIGLRVGASIPTGDLYKDSRGNTYAAGDYVTTGGAFAVEGGLRFARSFYAGVYIEGASYGKGSSLSGNGLSDATLSGLSLGAVLAYISNPYGVGFYGEIGVGYRSLSLKTTSTDLTTGNSVDTSGSLSGGELVLGAGVHILAARSLRIIPKIQIGIGSFTHTSCSTSVCAVDDSSFQSSSHAFVFLGVGGYYNIDLR